MAPSPPNDDHEGGYGSSPYMKTIAKSILVMGVSLVLVIAIYLWFGYIGPSFSANRQIEQQKSLREQYGLPAQAPVSKELLEVPPSMRDLAGTTATASSNATGGNQSAGSNATSNNSQTSAAGNQTAKVNATAPAGNATAGGQTTNRTGGGASTTTVSIVQGAASKTNDAFSPNPIKTKVGSTVTWTNKDSTPHTVTSGSSGKPDGKFDSSPGLKTLITPGQTFDHKFTAAGSYPYYCQLHPNMVGTVSVS